MSMMWNAGDVIANGIKIHYYRTGGDKPPVVLAHGITGNALNWMRLARVLEKDYDLVMYDARGHGLSEVPKDGHTPQDHAADLAGLIEALGIEKPALVGHSMGAADVAMTVATYPDLARCAVLEDPPWKTGNIVEEREARAKEWRAELVAVKSRKREDVIAEGRQQHPTWGEEDLEGWADGMLQVSLNAIDWVTTEALPPSWQEIIGQIACPTLLITADPDLGAIVTPELAQEAAGLCASLQVVHIAGAGHSIRREQFDAYVSVVSKFLGEA